MHADGVEEYNAKDEAPEAVWGLRFFLRSGKIYYVYLEDDRYRLCILAQFKKTLSKWDTTSRTTMGFNERMTTSAPIF